MLKVKSFVFSPIQENTYVLYNHHKHCIIIDPGCYYDDEKEQLTQFLQANNLTPTLLLNTHCHLDHIFGNKYVAETYNLKPHIHINEKTVLDYATTSGLMYNLPFDNYMGEYIFLKEGDGILLDEDELIVIEAPGHSPGHICFYCKEQNFIISGDVLFKQSIGRTDLPGGNHNELIKNIKEKIITLPPQTIVYSGHGGDTTIENEIKQNPFLQ